MNAEDILLDESFAQKPLDWAMIRRLGAYAKPYRKFYVLTLGGTVLGVISQLLGPKLIQLGIDKYLAHMTTRADAMRGIFIISAFYLCNLLLGWGLQVVRVRSSIRVGPGHHERFAAGSLPAHPAAVAELFRQDPPRPDHQPRRFRHRRDGPGADVGRQPVARERADVDRRAGDAHALRLGGFASRSAPCCRRWRSRPISSRNSSCRLTGRSARNRHA